MSAPDLEKRNLHSRNCRDCCGQWQLLEGNEDGYGKSYCQISRMLLKGRR